MDIVVFYDDCFAKEFKNMSTAVIRDTMAIVQKQFLENGTLGTTIQFQEDFPIIPHLESTWCEEEWSDILNPSGELAILANGSTFDANAYVFLTTTTNGKLGLAPTGGACRREKGYRISIAAYEADKGESGNLSFSEVHCNSE